MVALALVFCVAIVLSNVSLRIIPVSFNQVPPPHPAARQTERKAARIALPEAQTGVAMPHAGTNTTAPFATVCSCSRS